MFGSEFAKLLLLFQLNLATSKITLSIQNPRIRTNSSLMWVRLLAAFYRIFAILTLLGSSHLLQVTWQIIGKFH